jgi:phosphoribosylamine---glycine ligase
MRILFVSSDASGASLCYRLHKEGNEVRFYISSKDKYIQRTLDGMVKKIHNFDEGIRWVGKKGLIVFDYTGYGKTQDKLRKDGYSVIGGSEFGDKLEDSRQYGQKIFSVCGMKIIPSVSFKNASSAIKFLKDNKGPWVLKQNGPANKSLNYVSKFKDNRDILSLLSNYSRLKYFSRESDCFDLQKKIEGIEIGVGRYFNGKDWVGPIELDIEHKDLFNDDLGPKTFEMGTLIWYSNDEKNLLFLSTLAKLKPYLQKINFRGDININCIVNETVAYPLEATARFGYPAIQLHMEIQQSPWAKFLKALADGENYNLKWEKGYGIVVLIATPPFPYHRPRYKHFSPEGITIHFKDELLKQDLNHIHFEGVMKKKNGEFCICDNIGYALHVSGMDKTVAKTRDKVYSIIQNIVIPKMYYRTDIGLKFIKEDERKLREWGWIE